jgi:hypothetical protein
MRPFGHNLAVWLAGTLALVASGLWAQTPKVDPAGVPGSKVRQLMLKQALEKQLAGSLTEELAQNAMLWKSLAPEQVRELREKYLAFLKNSPDEQAALLEAAQEFGRLSSQRRSAYQERQEWLDQVINRLTPREREELLAMQPQDRAKRLLELKAKLAATQPASAPASQPATWPNR